MITMREMLLGVVLPMVLGGVAAALCSWGLRGRLRRGFGAVVVMAAGYAAAHLGLVGVPNVMPTPSQHAIAWGLVIGAVFGVVDVIVDGVWGGLMCRAVGAAVRLAGAASIVALMGWRRLSSDRAWSSDEVLTWGAGVLSVWALWMLFAAIDRRVRMDGSRARGGGLEPWLRERERWGSSGGTLVASGVAGVSAPAVVIVGSVQVAGQLLGAMAIGLVMAGLAGFASPRRGVAGETAWALGRVGSGAAAGLIGSAWVNACIFADLPAWLMVGLACAPSAALLVDLGLCRGWGAWSRVLLRIALAVIAAGLIGGVPAAFEFVRHKEEYGV